MVSINFLKNSVRNLNFGSRVVYENSNKSLTSSQKDYIDRFEEGRVSDVRYLGEGVTSKAYYSNSQNFVIKQNKDNPYIAAKRRDEMGSLAHENKILLSIDDHVKSTQKGVAYVETYKGGKFLLSTLVNGKPADRYSNPFTSKHIDRLLRTLYRLDKSEIIHCDLSRPNLLLNNNYDVNIIDYQWAEKFDKFYPASNYRLQNSNFPTFELPNNATMFETAALPGYLREFTPSDAEEFFKAYLVNKGEYTEKKARKLESYYSDHSYLTDCFSEFERAKTKAYKAIDRNILTAELLKMNLLNLHRRQYSCYDENKIDPRNILRSIPLMIKAKQCANKLSEIQAGFSQDETYFKYMNKYGKFWQEKINLWYPQTMLWLYNVMTGVVTPKGKILFPDKFQDYSGLNTAEIKNDISKTEKSWWDILFGYDEVEYMEKELKNIFLKSYKNTSEYYTNKSKITSYAEKLFKKVI